MFTVHHVTKAPTTRRAQDSYAVAPSSLDVNAIDVNTHRDVIGYAHRTGAVWAINAAGRFLGLAKSREIAVTTLERVAATANKVTA